MPPGFDPGLFIAPLPSSLEALQSILKAHDLEGLSRFEVRLASLPTGAEHLNLSRAIAYYEDQRGWREKSRSRYESLLSLYAGDATASTRLLLDLMEVSMRWSDLDEMQRCLERARSLSAQAFDPLLGAYLLRGESLLTCLRGDQPAGKSQMSQALEGFQTYGGWPEVALGLNGMSYTCLMGKQWEEAVEYSRQGLRGDQEALPSRLRGDLLSNHAYALRRILGNRVALPWAEDAYTIRLEQRDPLLTARTGVNLAEIYRALGCLHQAEAVLEHGLDELKNAHLEDQAGAVANSLGALRFTQGDYAGSVTAYQEALRLAKKIGESRLEAITSINLGEVFYQWGDYRSASQWYERCAKVHQEHGNLAKAVEAWLDAARLMSWVDPNEVQAILGRALKTAEKSGAGEDLIREIQVEIDSLAMQEVPQRELRIQPRPTRLPAPPPPPAPEDIAAVDEKLTREVGQITYLSSPESHLQRIQAILAAVGTASKPALIAAMARLAGLLEETEPASLTTPRIAHLAPGVDTDLKSYLAVLCASLAEHGADPCMAAGPVIAAAKAALQLALAFKHAGGSQLENALAERDPQRIPDLLAGLAPLAVEMPAEARAWNSLHSYAMGLAGLLARSPAERRRLRRDTGFRSAVKDLIPDCSQLSLLEEILSAPAGDTLLVIHPELKRGYRLSISEVTGNFQLHTLLAYLLVGDPKSGWLPGVRPNRRVVAAERGTLIPPEELVDQGLFNMVSWRGLHPDGTLSSNPSTWIWGEGRPQDIPRFEGQWVILMGPLPFQRSWNAGPKFAGMRAECILEEILPEDDVIRLMERIATAAIQE